MSDQPIVNLDLSIDEIRSTYEKQGIVMIKNFLTTKVAQAASQSIKELRSEFPLIWNNGTVARSITLELPPNVILALKHENSIARQKGLLTFLYYRWLPHRNCVDHAICRVAAWFRTKECCDLIKTLTGVSTSYVIDGGLTCYAREHYLDEHTDRLEDNGFRRKIAFMLSFSRNWDATMGGLLTLVHPDGTENIFVPQFNSLTLMNVEGDFSHAVTPVETDEVERITLVGFFSTTM
jgi:Rps23 Pro-64 3,4-dihydroxylase Tpa1-like proline 4-hydroxylase